MQKNPMQTYRALLLDYDALLAASDVECCYSLSEREIQIMLAFVDYVGWKTRYIATETEIDPILITVWAGNLARKLMSGCCPDEGLIHRFTEDGVYQTSNDGGATWYDDPQHDPRETATLQPPLPGTPGNDYRCQAAANVTAHLKDNADHVIDSWTVGAGITEIVAALIGILVFIGIIGSGGVLAPLLIGLAGSLIFAGSAAFAAAMTESVYDTLNCIIYCNMAADGTVTDANVSQMAADVVSQLSGIAADYLAKQIIILGRVGITNAGRTSSTRTFDCSSCPCAWCYTFDFTVGQQGWQVRNTVEFGDIGRYTAGVGFQQRTDYNTVDNITIENTPAGSFTITEAHIAYSPDLTGSNPKTTLYLNSYGAAFLQSNGGSVVHFVFPAETFTFIAFDVDPDIGSFEQWTGAVISITLRGTGANPFGADNC